MPEIFGTCDPRFSAVEGAFSRNFILDEDVGAACSIYLEGEKVVDIWGGNADDRDKTPWEENTLCAFYSTGKPFVATTLLQLVDEGRIQLDDPVAEVWPEFAAEGKDKITYRQVLCHQSGVIAIDEKLPPEAAYDWDLLVTKLAAQKPWWEPGTRHIYHTFSFGFLVAEPVRRLTGLKTGEYLRERIFDPLGEEFHIGVPDDALPRLATMHKAGEFSMSDRPRTSVLDRDDLPAEARMLAFGAGNPPNIADGGLKVTKEWKQAQIPATNGHSTARAIAHFYGILAEGGETPEMKLLSAATLAEATKVQSEGPCPQLKRNVSFGLGFQVTRPDRPFGSGSRAFGHHGNGGSVGYADPDKRLGFAYVMNYVKGRGQNSRSGNLMSAIDECLQ